MNNRIEEVARDIYEAMSYDGPPGTAKPPWLIYGNSDKQEEARRYARAAINRMHQETDYLLVVLKASILLLEECFEKLEEKDDEFIARISEVEEALKHEQAIRDW